MAPRIRSFAELRARVTRPLRERLADVDAALEGVLDPREAWEIVASRGLVPPAWIDAPERGFASAETCARCEGDGAKGPRTCSDCEGFGLASSDLSSPPNSLDAVRALAADVRTIERAEALAREVLSRLHAEAPMWPFALGATRGVSVERLAWIVASPRWIEARIEGRLTSVCPLAASRSRVSGGARYAYRNAPLQSIALGLPRGTDALTRAAAQELDRLTWWKRVEASAEGRRAPDESLNPFVPLVEVWSLGAVPIGVHRGAMWLALTAP